MLQIIIFLQTILIVFLVFRIDKLTDKIKCVDEKVSPLKSNLIFLQKYVKSNNEQISRVYHKQGEYIIAFNFIGKMLDKLSSSSNLQKIMDYADSLEEKESEVKEC